ncbi:MAG: ATP-dependent Clp protease adaptor ClpS [Planctomycetota bacterium]
METIQEVETKRRRGRTSVVPEERLEKKVRRQPPYHVILHDDDQHTWAFVIGMLRALFGMSYEKAYKHTHEVHYVGVSIVCTTTLEHAELKRDQIRSKGMSASIEPAT